MNLTTVADAEAALTPYGYDPALQARFAERVRAGASDNTVKGRLEVMPDDAFARLPALDTPERARLRDAGLQLVREGKVGLVVLAGGMATRFGGVVKAIVPARGTQSFLEVKHDDVATLADHAGARIPIFVMSSFSTHEVIRSHIAEKKLAATDWSSIEVFPQAVALRLTSSGELFHDANGALSPYATGHGDLIAALRKSGVLQRFRAAGGTILMMSNVDNLGATLDPAIIALHAHSGAAVTAEVVKKDPGDAGGAPALLDGKAQIIEGFRFPKDFDQGRIEVFNTNTFTFDAAAIDRDFELPYYRVEKKVDGQTVVQFERLVGELTAFLPSRFVRVERTGDDCRFIPVKEPIDLERQQGLIDRVARSKRSIRDLEPNDR
jgi:UTP--glucose-1-phosphate uridylyltransferase